jgi:hypothetical protein
MLCHHATYLRSSDDQPTPTSKLVALDIAHISCLTADGLSLSPLSTERPELFLIKTRFPALAAHQAVALGPRREYHLASALGLSWFLSCPELQVDFPRAAPIGLARHTHRPHRPCFRRFGRTSSAHTEGAQVPRGGACLWPWKHAHCFARATSDARTRCGTS